MADEDTIEKASGQFQLIRRGRRLTSQMISNNLLLNELLVNALVKIGNHDVVMKECEPNVTQPMELEEWMVKRTLYSLLLFQNTWDMMRENNKK